MHEKLAQQNKAKSKKCGIVCKTKIAFQNMNLTHRGTLQTHSYSYENTRWRKVK